MNGEKSGAFHRSREVKQDAVKEGRAAAGPSIAGRFWSIAVAFQVGRCGVLHIWRHAFESMVRTTL